MSFPSWIRSISELQHVCRNGSREEAVRLFSKNPEFLKESFKGHYLIHEAAEYNNVHVLEELLNRGADVNACTLSNRTPLIIAASKGYVEIIQKLMDYGADPFRKDKSNRTARITVVSQIFSRTSLIERLYKFEFLYACARGLVEEIEKLIKEDPAKSKTLLESGLNAASCNGEIKAVELLVLEGARQITDNVSHAAAQCYPLTASYLMLCSHCLLLDTNAVRNLTGGVSVKECGVDVVEEDGVAARETTELTFDTSFDLRPPLKLIVEGRDKLFGTDEEAEDCIFYVIQTRHDTDNSIMDWTSLGLTYISERWLCSFENLREMDVSHNQIGPTLPDAFSDLRSLNRFSCNNNALRELPKALLELPSLVVLNASSNAIERLPATVTMSLSLKSLNLASNQLMSIPEQFRESSIQTLKLSHNLFDTFPGSICMITSLLHLEIDHCKFTAVPNELGRLEELQHLEIPRVSPIEHLYPDLPKTARILGFLKEKLYSLRPLYEMKLVVVGGEGRGKTTLIKRLQKDYVSSKNVSTVGIEISKTKLMASDTTKKPFGVGGRVITFHTWDFGGQKEYYATHQCFITPATLYLLVFSLQCGDSALDELRVWLGNISARAVGSTVLIIGTYLDKVEEQECRNLLEEVNSRVQRWGFGSETNVLIPVITAVSCENETEYRRTVEKLAETIVREAEKMKHKKKPVLGQLIPNSYLELIDVINKLKVRYEKEHKIAVVQEEELWSIIRGKPACDDINSEFQFNAATDLMHNLGIILHFKEPSLQNQYFLDPCWLCSMMGQIVTIRERNPFVTSGILEQRKVRHMLKDRKFPDNMFSKYLRILNRFEIALKIDTDQILIPSLLPSDEEVSYSIPSDIQYFERQISFKNLPSGFIHRILVSTLSYILSVSNELCSPQFDRERQYSGCDSFEWEGRGRDLLSKSNHVTDTPREDWNQNCDRYSGRLSENSFSSQNSSDYLNGPLENDQSGCHDNELSCFNETASIEVKSSDIDMISNDKMEPYGDMTQNVDMTPPDDMTPHGDDLTHGDKVLNVKSAAFHRNRATSNISLDVDDIFLDEDEEGYNDDSEELILENNPARYDLLTEKYLKVWRRGLSFSHPNLHLYILPLAEDDLEGILFVVSRGYMGKRALCHIIDTISTLVEDWYPGLTSGFSENQVSQKIPCPDCHSHTFSYDDCLQVITESDEIICPNHPETPVKLDILIPDIFLSDLDAGNIENSLDVHFTETAESRLGGGAFGSVYKGSFRGLPVAVKTFNSFPMKPEAPYLELRREVNVLKRMSNVCIVKMLAVSLRPTQCLVIEYAPYSDLEHQLSSATSLPRLLLYKSCHQTACALAYLHKHKIIYRDIKPSNILVFSLDVCVSPNVKLSDYGIAGTGSVGGVKGFHGTPGFQAPEMLVYQGLEEYTDAVDVYSFAFLLYEGICRKKAYSGLHRFDINRNVMANVRPDGYKSIRMTRFGMRNLKKLMEECWVQDPLLRPKMKHVAKMLCHVGYQMFMGHTMPPNAITARATCSTFSALTQTLWIGCSETRSCKIMLMRGSSMDVSMLHDSDLERDCSIIKDIVQYKDRMVVLAASQFSTKLFRYLNEDWDVPQLETTSDYIGDGGQHQHVPTCIAATEHFLFVGHCHGFVTRTILSDLKETIKQFTLATEEEVVRILEYKTRKTAEENLTVMNKLMNLTKTEEHAILDLVVLTRNELFVVTSEFKTMKRFFFTSDLDCEVQAVISRNKVFCASVNSSYVQIFNLQRERPSQSGIDLRVDAIQRMLDCRDLRCMCISATKDVLWVGTNYGAVLLYSTRKQHQFLCFIRPCVGNILTILPYNTEDNLQGDSAGEVVTSRSSLGSPSSCPETRSRDTGRSKLTHSHSLNLGLRAENRHDRYNPDFRAGVFVCVCGMGRFSEPGHTLSDTPQTDQGDSPDGLFAIVLEEPPTQHILYSSSLYQAGGLL